MTPPPVLPLPTDVLQSAGGNGFQRGRGYWAVCSWQALNQSSAGQAGALLPDLMRSPGRPSNPQPATPVLNSNQTESSARCPGASKYPHSDSLIGSHSIVLVHEVISLSVVTDRPIRQQHNILFYSALSSVSFLLDCLFYLTILFYVK